MSDWNPEKYLQFKNQRTQPAIDLAYRVKKYAPKSIVDIGCGPGNSSRILKSVFPNADICGIDTSENMIAKAKISNPDISFYVCSAQELQGKYDLIFSNACLQWIPDHEILIPQLMKKLNNNGVLAVQMPMNLNEPLFQIIREVASSGRWDFSEVFFEKNDTLTPEEYFDILSECSDSFEQYETVYYHAMPNHNELLEWVRGTRLRPYLDVLSENEKADFEKEIIQRLKEEYKFTACGEVILKFRRFFFIACKQ